MLQEMLTKTPGKVNQVIYWGKPLDWHNQTLTPNPDTLYFMTFLNTKDAGPIVIDIPPADANGSLNANFCDVWQVPLEDAGPLGVDKGKGVKLVMLPPDYTGKIRDGYVALQPGTWQSYALIRSNLKSHRDADVVRSLAYGKRVKVYPLSQAANPPETKFADVKDILFDSTIRYDESFFEGLNRIVQNEPWLDRDRAMTDQLRSLGIEKGKSFAPDAEMKKSLEAGVQEAHALLAARYDAGLPPFFDGTHWTYPAPPELIQAAQGGFTEPNSYPIDDRGLTYHYAYIGIKRLGAGQFYLINIKDKAGESYDGGKTYRLTVPPNAPVEQYWSVTVYDRETHAPVAQFWSFTVYDNESRCLIDTGSYPNRSSRDDITKNADGSVDLYFGPEAPTGKPPKNWIKTLPNKGWFTYFHLYGPTQPYFDKTWVLPDIEEVK